MRDLSLSTFEDLRFEVKNHLLQNAEEVIKAEVLPFLPMDTPPVLTDVRYGKVYIHKKWLWGLFRSTFGRYFPSLKREAILYRKIQRGQALFTSNLRFGNFHRYRIAYSKKLEYNFAIANYAEAFKREHSKHYQFMVNELKKAKQKNDLWTVKNIKGYLDKYFPLPAGTKRIQNYQPNKPRKKILKIHKRINDYAGVLTYAEAAKLSQKTLNKNYEIVKDQITGSPVIANNVFSVPEN